MTPLDFLIQITPDLLPIILIASGSACFLIYVFNPGIEYKEKE